MNFKHKIIKLIWSDIFDKLDKISNKAVSSALKNPLKTKYDKRHSCSMLSDCSQSLLLDSDLFHKVGLRICPMDVINILFRCKMFLASATEDEYWQRVWSNSWDTEYWFAIPRNRKGSDVDDLIDEYLNRLEWMQSKRTLLIELTSYYGENKEIKKALDDIIIEIWSTSFGVYDNVAQAIWKLFIWYTVYGSEKYSMMFASAQLRVFINMLQIAGFIYSDETEFWCEWVDITGPKRPFFLNEWYKWHIDIWIDNLEPWQKGPDWCMWRSFWYRWVSKLRLTNWVTENIHKFMGKYINILKASENPWYEDSVKDIAPVLDMLSSATKAIDYGVKSLLLCCCLEHLFVPKWEIYNQKKYIIWALTSVKADLCEWYEKCLYKIRCDYAHKWFIKRSDATLIVHGSFENIMSLLNVKLMNKRFFK